MIFISLCYHIVVEKKEMNSEDEYNENDREGKF
jgi:hypothetical protein